MILLGCFAVNVEGYIKMITYLNYNIVKNVMNVNQDNLKEIIVKNVGYAVL
jgi:hypothetical protein